MVCNPSTRVPSSPTLPLRLERVSSIASYQRLNLKSLNVFPNNGKLQSTTSFLPRQTTFTSLKKGYINIGNQSHVRKKRQTKRMYTYRISPSQVRRTVNYLCSKYLLSNSRKFQKQRCVKIQTFCRFPVQSFQVPICIQQSLPFLIYCVFRGDIRQLGSLGRNTCLNTCLSKRDFMSLHTIINYTRHKRPICNKNQSV